MIVGDSLWGVFFALVVYLAGTDAPLALVGERWATPGLIGGTLLFAALTAWLYARTRAAARG